VANPKAQPELIKKIAPSTFLNKLATINRTTDPADGVEPPSRSTGFTEKPREIQPYVEEKLAQKRDERLALIDSLEPGPYEHTAPYDDPDFARLEPHSGINLMYVAFQKMFNPMLTCIS
jgi:minichromosome maintenance protein 10